MYVYIFIILRNRAEYNIVICDNAQRGAAREGRDTGEGARARTPAEKEPRKSAVPVTIALKAAAREQTMKKLTERRQGRSLDQYIPYTRGSGPLVVACQSSVLPTVKPLSRLGFVIDP